MPNYISVANQQNHSRVHFRDVLSERELNSGALGYQGREVRDTTAVIRMNLETTADITPESLAQQENDVTPEREQTINFYKTIKEITERNSAIVRNSALRAHQGVAERNALWAEQTAAIQWSNAVLEQNAAANPIFIIGNESLKAAIHLAAVMQVFAEMKEYKNNSPILPSDSPLASKIKLDISVSAQECLNTIVDKITQYLQEEHLKSASQDEFNYDVAVASVIKEIQDCVLSKQPVQDTSELEAGCQASCSMM